MTDDVKDVRGDLAELDFPAALSDPSCTPPYRMPSQPSWWYASATEARVPVRSVPSRYLARLRSSQYCMLR